MPTEQQRNSADNQGAGAPPPACGSAATGGPDEFLSVRDILAMILCHWRAILLFVFLVTLAAGVFFMTRPRQYEAEGYLQIIPPVSKKDGVNKDLFETMMASHLQKASSAFMAKNVAGLLNNQGIQITPLNLAAHVQVTRPPKTNLIRLAARETSADKALLIAQLWLGEYLAGIPLNIVQTALSQTRFLLKQTQADLMEKQATVEILRAQVAQCPPLITVLRSVDDRQLWSALTQPAAPDPEALKKLSEIHIKVQEQNEEYINLKKDMFEPEQELSEILARRNLYQETERLLEAKLALMGASQPDKTASTNAAASEAGLYVDTLMKNNEVIPFGEPTVNSIARGGLKQTALFFLASLGLACFGAFMCEWGKGLLSSR